MHTFSTYGQDKKDAQRHLEPDAPIVSSRSLFWARFVNKQFWCRGPYLGPIWQSVAIFIPPTVIALLKKLHAQHSPRTVSSIGSLHMDFRVDFLSMLSCIRRCILQCVLIFWVWQWFSGMLSYKNSCPRFALDFLMAVFLNLCSRSILVHMGVHGVSRVFW